MKFFSSGVKTVGTTFQLFYTSYQDTTSFKQLPYCIEKKIWCTLKEQIPSNCSSVLYAYKVEYDKLYNLINHWLFFEYNRQMFHVKI